MFLNFLIFLLLGLSEEVDAIFIVHPEESPAFPG